ncbi:uncharacterized protein LOC125845820 [Solanum stenotomum]|uniref:uncharacterized protein LOC125845820 n=1 Tax=Solanum stenotomum TaxID=172797 RepID=UPI0020D12AF1|nr:uncharacterized protein LOC125845820 [Solanum stenotomum]
MHPRRGVQGCHARRKFEDQGVPNAPEVQPQGEVTNAEFQDAIQMLSQVVTNIDCQQRAVRQDEADISRIFEFLRSNPSDFIALSVEEVKKKFHAPSAASAPAPKNRGEFKNLNSHNIRARPTESQGSVAQGGNGTYAGVNYGRTNSGICHDGSTCCFKYGQNCHFMRECPKNRQGSSNRGNRAQSSSFVRPDRAAPRGATSGTGGGPNRLMAPAELKGLNEQLKDLLEKCFSL